MPSELLAVFSCITYATQIVFYKEHYQIYLRSTNLQIPKNSFQDG